MMLPVRVVLVVVVVLSALMLPSTARGEDAKATARREFGEGTKSYNLSEYAQALEQFKAAYRAVPDPAILFNIGQCQRQLKQRDEAIKSYRSYLRNAPDASNRTEVATIVASMEREAAEETARANAAQLDATQKAQAREQAEQKRKEEALAPMPVT